MSFKAVRCLSQDSSERHSGPTMALQQSAKHPNCQFSWPWLILTGVMVLFIWGNSLVPGTGSSNLSETVVHIVQSTLALLGLPWEWVTNFVVRKAAHFTEYMVLGLITAHAFDPHYTGEHLRLFQLAILLVLVPSIDEAIQLFVPGRSGQVIDVLIDCCGAATGVLISYVIIKQIIAVVTTYRTQ